MAARGVNKVILIGNVGKDPEVRYFPDGGAIANLRVATSEKWTDKATGEIKEATEWHTVVARGKLADVIKSYVHKGEKLYVEGSIRTREWADNNGNKRYSTEVHAREIQMLGGNDRQPAAPRYTPPAAPQQAPVDWQAPTPQPSQDFDDDIPF